MGWARLLVAISDAERDSRLLEEKAREAGVRVLDWRTLPHRFSHKSSVSTFFILGSGSSVNKLSSRQWACVKNSISVGVNNWAAHPFIPDMYALESVPRVGDGKDLRRAFEMLSRKEVIEAEPLVLVLRPSSSRELPEIELLPGVLRDQLRFYGRVTPPTRRLRNLRSDLGLLFRALQRKKNSVFVDSGASILRLVGLGVASGCATIVFAGVDLNGTQYFWEENPDILSGHPTWDPRNNQRPAVTGGVGGMAHETMETLTRPFSVTEMLRAMAPVIEHNFGVKMFVASPQSALAAFLPVYGWDGD